jgi:hypothetical protein
MNVRVAFDQPGLRDLHQQLAEVLALEQAKERGRRVAEGAAALARLYQHHRECNGHGAASLPEREAMALGLDGDALDRGCYARSGQRLPTIEGAQATSSVTCRSGSSPEQKLSQRPCSPNQRCLTSISAATASMFNKERDIPVARMGARQLFGAHFFDTITDARQIG